MVARVEVPVTASEENEAAPPACGRQTPATAKQPEVILKPLAAVVVPPVIIRLEMVPVARLKLVEKRLVDEAVVLKILVPVALV